jgi:hypothetical protein
MRMIQKVKATDEYLLECSFDDGSRRMADIKPYLQTQAFQPLHDVNIFKRITNNQYYVSWQNEEIDLSADTLWHIGREV